MRDRPNQAPVVQKMYNTIHWINFYPGDSAIDFPHTYPLDSAIQLLNNRGQTKIAAGRLVGNQDYKGRQFRLALSSYKEILPVASER